VRISASTIEDTSTDVAPAAPANSAVISRPSWMPESTRAPLRSFTTLLPARPWRTKKSR